MKRKVTHVRFPYGKLVATRRITEELDGMTISCLLTRHLHCDWGELCEEDWKMNDAAVRNGERLLSSYQAAGQKVFIITECDRSVTTILFADEY
ncbi:hypothetical protein AGATL06_24890 [Agathobaculum sp. TL06]